MYYTAAANIEALINILHADGPSMTSIIIKEWKLKRPMSINTYEYKAQIYPHQEYVDPRSHDNDPYLFNRYLAQAHHHAKSSQPQTSKRSRATTDTSTQSPASSHQPAVTSQQSQASSHKPTAKKRGPAAGGRRPLNIERLIHKHVCM